MSLCHRLRITSSRPKENDSAAQHEQIPKTFAEALNGIRSIQIPAPWQKLLAHTRTVIVWVQTHMINARFIALKPQSLERDLDFVIQENPSSNPLPIVSDLANVMWLRKRSLPEGPDERQSHLARARLFLISAGFSVAFAIAGMRLIYIMLPTSANSAPESQVTDTLWTVSGARADIMDAQGQLLATSVTTASLYADSRKIIDPHEAIERLLTVLPDLNPALILKKFNSKKAFVWIKRDLTPRQHQLINDLGVPGLYFRQHPRRLYPHGGLAAHVVGFVDLDDRGLTGLERSQNARLTKNNPPLRLTLDIRIQHMLRQELRNGINQFNAMGGAGLVMDVKTGALLSLVSLPDFDPSMPGAAPETARFNRATLGLYEMGSTFKIFTTAMILDAGQAHLNDQFDATMPIKISRFEINDFEPRGRWLTVEEIFHYSSNIGAARMAIKIGRHKHQAFLKNLGLLSSAKIGLPEISTPLFPDLWQDINTMTIAFGHGVAVSPLQLVTAVSSIVNGGFKVTPYLLASAIKPERSLKTPDRVISSSASQKIRRLMRRVVIDGTGRKADVPGYRVGGKTGTAEKSAGQTGYRRKALISSFIAAFPMEKPRYVVFVMLDEPEGTEETRFNATGGWVAAPIIARFITRAAPFMGVTPGPDPIFSTSNKRGKKIITAYPNKPKPVQVKLAPIKKTPLYPVNLGPISLDNPERALRDHATR